LPLARRQQSIALLQRGNLAGFVPFASVHSNRDCNGIKEILIRIGFVRKSIAPAFMALTDIGTSPNAVITMTGRRFFKNRDAAREGGRDRRAPEQSASPGLRSSLVHQ
jgi:hypothetical protein